MITVRAKMEHRGVWYALGAHENNTVVIREDGDEARYFWSKNGGKSFYLQDSAVGNKRAILKVKWPAGGIAQFKSISEVEFFNGGNGKVFQLIPLLKKLGFMPEEKVNKPTVKRVSGNLLAEFPQMIQKEFGENIKWSSNLGTSQRLIYRLYCPGEKVFIGKSDKSQKDAKLKAIAQAMEYYKF